MRRSTYAAFWDRPGRLSQASRAAAFRRRSSPRSDRFGGRDFRPVHGEEFVRYLRSKRVAPNGHAHARKRTLRDCGIKFILETCSTLFNYAQRHRPRPPYVENPFRTFEIGRIPIEDAKPVVAFTADQERRFLEACDVRQFPIFLTLVMTGLRPGELTHLLLPDDLDLVDGWLFVRNKPNLGWQIKTRNERHDIPLLLDAVYTDRDEEYLDAEAVSPSTEAP